MPVALTNESIAESIAKRKYIDYPISLPLSNPDRPNFKYILHPGKFQLNRVTTSSKPERSVDEQKSFTQEFRVIIREKRQQKHTEIIMKSLQADRDTPVMSSELSNDKPAKQILVVDDEPRMVRFVKMNLDLEGYQTLEANDGFQALDKVREYEPNLVLLDVEMPGLDGFETLKRLREISDIPAIMLTVRSDEEDRIKGLDLGADDYVTKPFSPRELSSRIRAVLRRFEVTNTRPEDQIVTIDDRLQVDLHRRDVIVEGERLSLRPTEYRLLHQLIQNAGWVVPHEVLLTKVWGHEYVNDNHLLRLYITYLRKKIEPDLSEPRYIFTERGLGYRFVDFKKRKAPTADSSEENL